MGGADRRERSWTDPDSTLSFFRRAIELRRSRAEFGGVAIEWLDRTGDVLAFRLVDGGLVCVLNAGRRPVALPDGELILASAPLVDGKLAPNTAAWLVT